MRLNLGMLTKGCPAHRIEHGYEIHAPLGTLAVTHMILGSADEGTGVYQVHINGAKMGEAREKVRFAFRSQIERLFGCAEEANRTTTTVSGCGKLKINLRKLTAGCPVTEVPYIPNVGSGFEFQTRIGKVRVLAIRHGAACENDPRLFKVFINDALVAERHEKLFGWPEEIEDVFDRTSAIFHPEPN